ncbi:MAG: 2OG-Fe(II) oxygenase [Acidobacteria bacterium]|nr:2OG-Fe(II) oxygenase [Acidobacteriota bacterium]
MNQTNPAAELSGVVRSVVVEAADIDSLANAVEQIYDDVLDVILLRQAFPENVLHEVGGRLDNAGDSIVWERPNAVMPPDDIGILGTDIPATPTYRSPQGPSLDAYLESANRFDGSTANLFGTAFDFAERIKNVLGRLAGGRPVEVPVASDGRRYVPYTIRLLGNGKQISVHHDYHYPLALYKSDLATRLDTRTLVSFFVTLQQPERGGDLVVYSLRSDSPDQPALPTGQWDVAAIAQKNTSRIFTTQPGDLILLASGRCFHRVERVAGTRSRVTLGGFLAFDKNRTRVLYWS